MGHKPSNEISVAIVTVFVSKTTSCSDGSSEPGKATVAVTTITQRQPKFKDVSAMIHTCNMKVYLLNNFHRAFRCADKIVL